MSKLFTDEFINYLNSLTEDAIKNYYENKVGELYAFNKVECNNGVITLTFKEKIDAEGQDVLKILTDGGTIKKTGKEKNDKFSYYSFDGVGKKL